MAMRRHALSLVIAAVLVGSCGGSGPDDVVHPVSGAVSAGPTCPAISDPPDPACDDRPVEGARLVITTADGKQVAEAVTDADGAFTVELATGRYVVTPQPVAGLLGTPAAVDIDVTGVPLTVEFAYDTGIR